MPTVAESIVTAIADLGVRTVWGVGLPEFGTELGDVDIAAIARASGLHGERVTDGEQLDAAVRSTLAHDGPAVLDVVTNPEEVALPPRVTPADAWGFAIAKLTETLESRSG